MVNQIWTTPEKTFHDNTNGLRLKVRLTHGIIRCSEGYTPATCGQINLLPNDGENISAFVEQMGTDNSRQAYANQQPRMLADGDIRRNGIGIITNIHSQAGEGIGKPKLIMKELSRVLHEKGRLKGKVLEPRTAQDIQNFLDENLSNRARNKAQKISDLTGRIIGNISP